jgi:hypothetical protein
LVNEHSKLLILIPGKQLKYVLQMLFPQLIIYRVARGSAWTEKTSQELTQATASLVFARHTINTVNLDSEPNALTEEAHYSVNRWNSPRWQAASESA